MKRFTPTLLLAASLAAITTTAHAEGYLECTRAAPEFNVNQVCVWRDGPPPAVQPEPATPAAPTAPDNTLHRANAYAARGDARTLQQAQAHADAGDARTLSAAMQHSTALVAGLRREAFAGIAAAAALVPMDPNTDGQTTLNVGAATYGGQTALGVALSHQAGRTVLNAGVGFGSNGSKRTLVRVGLGWRF